MTAPEILTLLRARGVKLATEGSVLRWRPKTACTPDEVEALKKRKWSIITWLQPAPEHECRECNGGHFWRHARYGHWICSRCHPAPVPGLIAEEQVGESVAIAPNWDPATEELVSWFTDEGQHRIPRGPFDLAPWIRITNPMKFKSAVLADIAAGTSGPRHRYGALTDDLIRLWKLLHEDGGRL